MMYTKSAAHTLYISLAVAITMVASSNMAAAAPDGEQWQLSNLSVAEAHETTRGEGITVGVIDTGIAEHPDLDSSEVLDGHAPGATDKADVYDRDGHGTGMTGLIAASGDGESSVMGMAPEAEVLPVKVQEGAGEVRGGNMYIAAGIEWAVDQGVDVINLSIGESADTEDLAEAIEYAQSKDVVVVAGAGNVYGGPVLWPAAYPGVMGVSATNPDGELWQDDDAGSSFGEEIDIAAPGAELRCLERDATGNGTGYDDNCRGTSPATAIMTGAAALVRAANPDMDAANVINRLISTAQQPDGSQERTDEFGYGIVDPAGALSADVDEVSANPLGSMIEESSNEANTAAENTGSSLPLIIAAVAGGVILLTLVVVGIVVAARGKKKREGLDSNVMPRPG